MKNSSRFSRKRIPKGFVLRVPHGGKPELVSLAPVTQPEQFGSQETDAAKAIRRRNLLDKACKLGLTEAVAFGHTWSLERLDGAVFDRYCLWADAKRAGVRANRRWSDRAMYDAMLRIYRQAH